MKYQNQKAKITKELEMIVKDKLGPWVQIEMLTGDEKGMRRPVPKDELLVK